jgi:hypothetical protein
MAWESGFFNSLNGDRRYNAEQLSKIFTGLISDGVYASVGDKLAVQPHSGMTIKIATGRGWFGGHWVNNSSEYYLDVEPADVTLNRYAAVVIKVDESEAVRSVMPCIKYGEFASSPSVPAIERTETVKEYFLGFVYIPAGTTEIKAYHIEDSRSYREMCGWVTGLIDQVDTATLYRQWEDLFFEWFNNLQDYLDENVETKLVADMQELKSQVAESDGKATKIAVTLDEWSWQYDSNGECYTQFVQIPDILESHDVIASPLAYYKDDYIKSGCTLSGVSEGYVMFICDTEPAGDIEVELIIFKFINAAG